MRFAWRFASTRRRRLAGIALIAALAVVGVAGIAAWSVAAADDGARRIVTDAEPGARSTIVHASRMSGVDPIDSAIERVLAEAFGDLPVEVERSLRLGVTCPSDQTCTVDGVMLVADEGVVSAAEMLEGVWPTSAGQAAITEAAAATAAVGVGDRLTVGGTTLDIVGVWRATDPAAVIWQSDPGVESGRDGAMLSPVIVTRDTILDTGSTADTTWTLSAAHIAATDAGAVAAGLGRLNDLFVPVDPERRYAIRTTGELDDTMRRIVSSSSSASGAIAVPLFVAAVLGVVVLWLTTASLSRSRAADYRLLRARGASTRRLAAIAGGEAAVAAAVGVLLAALVAVLVTGIDSLTLIGAWGAVVIVVTVVAASVTALGAARPAVARSDAGWRSVVALGLPSLFLAVAAGLATAQLLTHRSFVLDGRLDPAAAAAPALLLTALALLAPLLAAPLASLGQLLGRLGRGLIPVLPLRRIARRSGALAAGVLCLALAAGAGVLGSAIISAGESAATRQAGEQLGSDVRVRYGGDGDPAARRAVVAETPGVTDAVPVVLTEVTVGQSSPALLAAPAGSLALSAADVERLQDAAALAPVEGPLRVTASVVDHRAGEVNGVGPEGDVFTTHVDPMTMRITVFVTDDAGEVLALPVPPFPAAERTETAPQRTVELHPPAGSRVLALSVSASGAPQEQQLSGSVAVTAGGATLIETPVDLANERDRRVAVPGLPTTVPVVATAALAAELGLEVGQTLSMSSGRLARELPIEVVDVVPSLPAVGSDPALAADLATVTQAAVLAGGSPAPANEVWAAVGSADADAIGASIRGASVERVEVLTPRSVSDEPILTVAVRGVLLATIAVAVLAVAGFAGVAAESARSRETERLPLRAVGMTRAAQWRADAFEVVTTAAFAIIVGIAAGWAVAGVVVPIVAGAVA